MSKGIPFDTIVEAVFEGAQKGIKKYHRMSGGYDRGRSCNMRVHYAAIESNETNPSPVIVLAWK